MKIKIVDNFTSEFINIYFIIVLFIWASLFPQSIQERFQLAIKVFLILVFLIILVKKRTALLKFTDYPLWIFLIAISVNVLFAQQKDIALRTYLDLAIPMFTIYYLTSEVFSYKRSFDFLIKTISMASIIISLGGILESLFAFNLLYDHFIDNPYYQRYISGFVRPMSTQFNPAVLASYLLGCLPFNFILIKQSKSLFRLLGGLGIVLNITVIILTFSRGAFLGLIAMAIFYLLVQRRLFSLGVLVLTLVTLIFVSSHFPYPLNRLSPEWLVGSRGTSILSSYRIERYIMTQRIFVEHPFVGLGLQHFRLRFYDFFPGKTTIPYEIMIADNMYLTILAETGLIGFIGFFMFIIYLLQKSLVRLKALRYVAEARGQLLSILMSFIGLLVNLGGYEVFYWPNPYIFFCIIVGLINAYEN